jgi:hypothetical protein
MNPKYPVYIISKGRWEKRLTSNVLEKMKVPYHIVVEPFEYKNYLKYIDKKKIHVLPFNNLGQGSIPARNWVWNHSITLGAKRHWILDDNISHFLRLNRNSLQPVGSGTIFRAAEDFVDRYENIGKAGFNYDTFVHRKLIIEPYRLNTRIYSCILIRNDLPFRWRGRYNEDTDLSLRILKAGYCTVLFNAFVAKKIWTMTMKGGNTDNVYIDGDNRRKFAESLAKQHPDAARIVWKFNRWHHQVDYTPFRKNILRRKPDYNVKKGINNYGMKLVKVK